MKLSSELTYDEFEQLFVVFFCKENSISARTSNFEKKFQSYLEAFIPRITEVAYILKQKFVKTQIRFFPRTEKDLRVEDIEKVKQARKKIIQKREKRRKRVLNEKTE